MRAVVQRVGQAAVTADGLLTGQIGLGLFVLLAITHTDTQEDAAWLARKLAGLRVFEDGAGQMNRNVTEAGGGALVVSQFTLYGNNKKGNRPSFNRAAPPEVATPLYQSFCDTLSALLGQPVATGVFGTHTDISCELDGPVTLILDSHARDF